MANKLTVTVLACALLLAATNASPQQPGGIPGGTSSGVVGAVPGQPNPPHRTEAVLLAEIASQPSNLMAYMELAGLYRINNRMPEADALLRSALPIAPNPGFVYGALIALYQPQDHPEQVLAVAEEWKQAQPANFRPVLATAYAHLMLAQRLRRTPEAARDHVEQAMRALEDVKALQPELPELAMVFATMLRAKADLETDPTERASLLHQADEWMSQVRARSQQSWSSNAAAPTVQGRPPALNGPVRVGGNIQPPAKIKDVRPHYPPEAQQARIQGVVIVEVLIDENGKVKDARVLRSIPMLDAAAVDAVRQWEFTPTLLNGQGVQVIMTATVQFSLP